MFIYIFTLTTSILGLLPARFSNLWQLWPLIEVFISFLLNIYRIHAQNLAKFCICFDTDKLWLLSVSFLQLVTYGPWVMPARIPFPLDIVRTNGWDFTQFYICIYIGKILDGILPIGPWLIFLQHEMHYSAAIVRFSEFNIAEACWPILFTFYVYRQKGSGQLNTIWGQLWAKMDFYRKW